VTRSATTGDIALAAQWAEERNAPALPVNNLPQCGVVYVEGEPQAMAWMYVDDYSRTGFPHWLITRPGSSLAESRRAVFQIFESLANYCRENDITTMITTVFNDACAREALTNFDFHFLGSGVTLFRPI